MALTANLAEEFHALTHRSVRWLCILGLAATSLFAVADSLVIPHGFLLGWLLGRAGQLVLLAGLLALNMGTQPGRWSVLQAYLGILGCALCLGGMAVWLGRPSEHYPAIMLCIAALCLIPWHAAHTLALGSAMLLLWGVVNFTGPAPFHGGQFVQQLAYLGGALAVSGTVSVARGRLVHANQQRQTDYEAALRQREKLARQTAHDIRSPVTALQVLQDQSTQLNEEDRLLLRDAIARVNDIANNLITWHSGDAVGPGSAVVDTPISPLLHALLAEKRASFHASGIQFLIKETGPAAAGFARVNAAAFTRSMSNLLNNAAESMSFAGVVNVDLEARGEHLELSIRDSGCGIDPQNLPKILAGGVSIGKAQGQGLGLASAAQTMQQFGGVLQVDSMLGVGTTVRIDLPAASPAPWFAAAINIELGTVVLALDDDTSMARLWAARLAETHATLMTFQRVENFVKAAEAHAGRRVCLVDVELYGNTLGGVQAVELARCWADAIFVTSRYNDLALQKACIDHGARIAPKAFAAHIPIRLLRKGTP